MQYLNIHYFIREISIKENKSSQMQCERHPFYAPLCRAQIMGICKESSCLRRRDQTPLLCCQLKFQGNETPLGPALVNLCNALSANWTGTPGLLARV